MKKIPCNRQIAITVAIIKKRRLLSRKSSFFSRKLSKVIPYFYRSFWSKLVCTYYLQCDSGQNSHGIGKLRLKLRLAKKGRFFSQKTSFSRDAYEM